MLEYHLGETVTAAGKSGESGVVDEDVLERAGEQRDNRANPSFRRLRNRVVARRRAEAHIVRSMRPKKYRDMEASQHCDIAVRA